MTVMINFLETNQAIANTYIERIWRSLKYEDVYLRRYETEEEACARIKQHIKFYTNERIHQALQYKVPSEAHFAA